ncbi:MAG TPA: ABC transporter ATP-binding protein [Candidatus Scatosoma pullistercoris]|uniref:ABC transporter ATP-binding protein n=1 Tax=Candidatus Scatosoma pullistercoris TaxID=2840934 RepID=A0A9D1SGT8_9FIRM|nr:ABC transporter ATP-binding protein [Candidatus Scatosoma pullistercoris]
MEKNTTNIIELVNVCKEFDGVSVIDNMNLYVRKGEFITLLGPSGCGKTTTLRMIAGFDMPTSGKILLNGKDISALPPNKRPVNTVFQKYALFPHLNVFDNVAFGLKLKRLETTFVDKKGRQRTKLIKLSRAEIAEKVKNALEIVDLEGFEKRSISTLSGGQQQRIAIARAIVNEPEILLLDEPLGALDLKMRKEMQLELKAMHQKLGITFIYVTHDQEEALTMSDTVVVMADGYIQQIGTPEMIYNEPKNMFVADFIGESNIFSGTMPKDRLVRFCGKNFVCEDGGFEKDEPVDVVVRPEDVKIVPPEKGVLRGKVTSVIFKGIHYQILVQCGRYEIEIQSTAAPAMEDSIGLTIEPDGIHVMKKVFRVNQFTGVITKKNTVKFGDGEFECDVTQLYPGSHLDEEGYLITAKGEKLDLTDTEVNVEVGLQDITMSDNPDEGGAQGHIISLIYKSEYYRYIVRTENEEDYVLACEDLWNENDLVSLVIPPEKIKLTLKNPEETKL